MAEVVLWVLDRNEASSFNEAALHEIKCSMANIMCLRENYSVRNRDSSVKLSFFIACHKLA